MRGYCSRSRKAPIPPTERGNFTEPKAQIEVTHEGRDSNLASSVSPHYNFSEIECFDTMLARGTPLDNANNLSVIGIYPAKKSNKNQKIMHKKNL